MSEQLNCAGQVTTDATYRVITGVLSRTWSAALWWLRATWNGWIDDLGTTVTPELIKAHLPTRRAVALVAWLLTPVQAAAQFI